MSDLRRVTVRTLPWAFGIAALCYVLGRTNLGSVARALEHAHWGRYLAVALVFSGGWLVLDAFVLARLVTRFHLRVRLAEMLPLRGATYVLLAFSYDAAQAALGLLLHRRFGIPALALGGTFLFYYLVDLLTISGLAGSASATLETGPGPALLPILAGVFVLLGSVLALGLWWARHPSERVPAWLRGTRFLSTLRRARMRDLVEFVGWRSLFYASFVAFAALTLPTFGIRVPLGALVAFVPLVMSLSALPVTVAGLGSTQLAMWAFYGTYGDPSAVVAYALVYNATLILLRLPIGFAYLPRLSWSSESGGQERIVAREEISS